MNAVASVSMQVLGLAFYRRHMIMLGLLALFLMGLTKPPQLLFTGMFIRTILQEQKLALAAGGLAFGWALYSGWQLLAYLRRQDMVFMVSLGALPRTRLFGIAFLNVILAGALGYLYLGLLAWHSFTLGQPMAMVFAAAILAGMAGMSLLLTRRLLVPVGPATGRRWMPAFRLGFGRMLWECLWREHRAALGIVKAFSMLFIVLMVIAGFEGVLPQIATLAFAVSGLLQGVLPFLLRKSEDAKMLWTRGLPIPWWQRMLGYAGVHLLLQAPELLLLSLATWSQGASIAFVLAYLAAVMGTQLLNLGLTYLPQMSGQDFMRMQFGLFVMSFLALVFSLPLAWIQVGLMALGVAICAWGTFRVNDDLGREP